jgi:TPR repeat protein
MDTFAELEIVRLDRIEKRAQKYFERAARHDNAHRMMRAAKLEMAGHAKAMTIVAAAVRPFNSFV